MNDTPNTTQPAQPAQPTPTQPDKPKPVELKLERHHDISTFASKDESRYVLRYVRHNPQAKRLEATDGRILAMVPYSCPETQPVECMLPAEPMGKFMRKLPKRSKCPPAQIAHVSVMPDRVAFKQEKEGEVNNTVISVDRDACGVFPKVEQVIPNYDASAPSVTLGPRYVKDIAEYAMKYGPEKGSIKFILGPAGNAVDIRVELEAKQEARFILMPLKIS